MYGRKGYVRVSDITGKCFARLLKLATSTILAFLPNIVKLGNSIKWQGSLILGRGAKVRDAQNGG